MFDLCMAKDFPSALPPTVMPDTVAATTILVTKAKIPSEFIFKLEINLITTSALAAPLTIEEISPITSLQMLENRSAFRIISMACLEPFTFSAAMPWNGISLAAVEAIPIMSNNIPMPTSTITMSMPIPQDTPSKTDVETIEKMAANINVTKNINTLHRMELRNEYFIAYLFLLTKFN